MGNLGLDFSSSRLKLARAREHLKMLYGETQAILDERPPYSTRVSEVDPHSGWCSVYMTPREFSEPILGLICGDIVHNLRCALDYTVATLIIAEGKGVETKHQFPIFHKREDYRREVEAGPEDGPYRQGPLKGIRNGLSAFKEAQPFNDNDPMWHPLYLIGRFDNADKHRMISTSVPMLANDAESRVGVSCDTSRVLEQKLTPPPTNSWTRNQELKILTVRFEAPYPALSEIHAHAYPAIDVAFGVVTTTRHDPVCRAMNLRILRLLCEHVSMILDLFEAL
jgi:hypothetical protein